MTVKKQFIYAILTAILAGVVTYVTQAMGGWPVKSCMDAGTQLTYLSFGTWACYFVCGCNPKGAANWFLSMAFGIVCAIFMFVLTFLFMPAMGYLIGVSVAVVILVIVMMFTDRMKLNSAGVFIGTAFYFALNASGALTTFTAGDYIMAGVAELIYTFIGLLAGYITIWFAGLVTKNSEE